MYPAWTGIALRAGEVEVAAAEMNSTAAPSDTTKASQESPCLFRLFPVQTVAGTPVLPRRWPPGDRQESVVDGFAHETLWQAAVSGLQPG